MKDFISSSYGDNKLSKQVELNSSMTIRSTGHDELTNKLRGGLGNAD